MTEYQEMQRVIDEAWHSENPDVIAFQKELFPAGKPTVEEFIAVVANHVKKQQKRAI